MKLISYEDENVVVGSHVSIFTQMSWEPRLLMANTMISDNFLYTTCKVNGSVIPTARVLSLVNKVLGTSSAKFGLDKRFSTSPMHSVVVVFDDHDCAMLKLKGILS